MRSLAVHNNTNAQQHRHAPKQQAIIQPKLMVNAPGDRYEQEADAMAERVMRVQDSSSESISTGMIGKSLHRKCNKCEEEEKRKSGATIRRKADNAVDLQSSISSSISINYIQRKCVKCEEEEKKKKNGTVMRKANGRGGFEAPDKVSSQLMNSGESGRQLPQHTRQFMENAFSTDFSHVRIHTDSTAAEMNKEVNAKAFTFGSSIYFGNGQFDVKSNSSKKLLAHELTHVVQQSPQIQKFGNNESQTHDYIYRQPDSPISYTVVDHDVKVGDKDSLESLLGLPPETIPAGALSNQEFLLSIISQSPNTSIEALSEVDGVPEDIAASIPEGKVVEMNPAALIGLPSEEKKSAITEHNVGGTLSGANDAIDHQLAHFGYASAGPNAIGIVAFPQSRLVRGLTGGSFLTPGPLLPESKILLGHTAIYVRVNGKITVIKSYAPESLVESALHFGEVRSGKGGVPAQIIDHLGNEHPPGGTMFEITSGQSIEYPVDEKIATKFAASLPEGGSLPGELYTAQPEVAAQLGKARLCNGRNCVLWAVREVEKEVGTLVTSQGKAVVDASGVDSARQGRMQGFLNQKSAATDLPNGESVKPVRGSMPTGIKILKIGTKIFEVYSYGHAIYNIWNAPADEKGQVIGEEVGGIGGGHLGGEAGVAICLALAPETGGLSLLVCGVVGGFVGSKVGSAVLGTIGGLYDLIMHPEKIAEAMKLALGPMVEFFSAMSGLGSSFISAPFELLFQNLAKTNSEYNMANWDMRYVSPDVQNDLKATGEIISDSLKGLDPDGLITVLNLPIESLGVTADIAQRLATNMNALSNNDPNKTAATNVTKESILQMTPMAFMDFAKDFQLAFIQDPSFVAGMEGRYENEGLLRVHLFPLIRSRARVNPYNWDLSGMRDVVIGDSGYTLHENISALGQFIWDDIGKLPEKDISKKLNSDMTQLGVGKDLLQEIAYGLDQNFKDGERFVGIDLEGLQQFTPEGFVMFLIEYKTGFNYKNDPDAIAATAIKWVKQGFQPW